MFSDRINAMACYQTPIGREDRSLCSHTAQILRHQSFIPVVCDRCKHTCIVYAQARPTSRPPSTEVSFSTARRRCVEHRSITSFKGMHLLFSDVSESQESFQTSFRYIRDSRPSIWSIFLYLHGTSLFKGLGRSWR